MEHFTTNTKHTAGFSQPGYAENNHNNNSTLVDINPVPGTPFAIVRQEEKYFLVMGDHKLTPDLPSEDDVKEYFQSNYWLILTNVVIILIKKHDELAHLVNQKPYETESL